MRLTIEEVIEKYSQNLFSLSFGICQNVADADDVVQDTFIKYFSINKEFESEEHLKAWLFRLTINRSKDLCTSFWHRHKIAWEEYMNEITFTEPKDSALFEAVMRLPGKYRIVIHLHYYEDYSVKEIAALLNRRENTVKSQLMRGRTLLKKQLEGKWNDDE